MNIHLPHDLFFQEDEICDLRIPSQRLLFGDCMQRLKELPDNSIDSVVCDPPYELGFMGKKWDGSGIAFNSEMWAECLRVLKAGGHLIAFGGTRTIHRITCAIEDAGFEIRDMIAWCYYSGFPKSLDISKAIDKDAIKRNIYQDFADHFKAQRKNKGLKIKEIAKHFPSKTGGLTGCVWNWENAQNVPTMQQFKILKDLLDLSDSYLPLIERLEAEREVIGKYNSDMGGLGGQRLGDKGGNITAPSTEEAQRWAGWGTALKPAYEPAILARKPIEAGSIARQVLSTGTGAINIDECRFGYGDPAWIGPNEYSDLRRSVAGGNNGILGTSTFKQRARNANEKPNPLGRWPANIYQCPKASRTEREQGLEHLEAQIPPAVQHQMETKPNKWKEGIKDPRAGAGRTASEVKNIHPTVKPLGLMRWLCRLITPKGGTVLDPFSGSGSTLAAATLEGFDSIGCELTAEYVPIIAGRIKWAREEYFNINAQLDIPW